MSSLLDTHCSDLAVEARDMCSGFKGEMYAIFGHILHVLHQIKGLRCPSV